MNRIPLIKVVIIEDDEVIRNSYAFLIEQEINYKVVDAFASFEEALKELSTLDFNVLLLDIGLPGRSGIDAIPEIKQHAPDCHIIMLTVFENEESIFRALKNGASGYLTKNTSSSKIISAINEVVDGGAPLSTNVASIVIRSFHKNTNTSLTKREIEILENISAGKSRQKISEEMFIDVETIKSHLKNIYFKLDVHTKAEAIKLARKERFI